MRRLWKKTPNSKDPASQADALVTAQRQLALSRRSALKGLLGLSALPLVSSLSASEARAQDSNRRFLFVVAASGGADIRDAFMPLSQADAGSGVRGHAAAELRTVGGLECIERADPLRFFVGHGNDDGQNGPVQRRFLEQHGADTAVMAVHGTSVNHIVAAQRWLNGAGLVQRGRTLLESHALQYASADMPLPAVNMANAGYALDGLDVTLPGFARAETVSNALLFGFATHPSQGVLPVNRGAQKEALLARARAVRESLDDASPFVARFRDAPMLKAYRASRLETVPLMQNLDLITELSMVASSPEVPLEEFGLSSSPELPRLVEAGFGDLATDPFMAQAALAYLLTKSGASCAVAIGAPAAPIAGPGYAGQGFTLNHTPIAFDFSHTDHEPTQLAMWDRTLQMTDGLIRLLKATPFGAGTMWDRSLVYIATEFGRSLQGQAGQEFSSGHELNNGAVIISPFVNGNRVYGRLDPQTGLIDGFDGATGDATADPAQLKREPELTATLARALGHDLSTEDAFGVQDCLLR
jgi:uncharacterized protein (DUF1501 family)